MLNPKSYLYLAVFLSSFLPEIFFQSLAAVGENVFALTANEDGMGNRAKRAEGDSIVNKVGQQYTCWRFFKVVQMMPESVRSADLVIDERLGLLERFNLGDPWHMYQRRDADAVGDDLTLDHFFRGTVSHREPQIGRGNLIEIARSGKKLPSFLERDRENLLLLQNVNFHAPEGDTGKPTRKG